jgi:monooxygenase
MAAPHFDVLIVGAGLSGIGAAVHLQRRCPGRSYRILERRDAIGGTWDLFRYPGVRSDSDMHTLGYSFKPWIHDRSIADGPSILDYVRETAREHGVEPHIDFDRKVIRADWLGEEARWTVTAQRSNGAHERYTCAFLFLCSGYYSYDEGHDPDFPGREDFDGRIVHPQFWPADLEHAGKRVVVIGSGATAITLVPEMAKTAAHVTMLQRSPTYVISRPARDAVANTLRRFLPLRAAYTLTRWKNVLLQQFFFRLARRRPEPTRRRLLAEVRKALGPGYDVDAHFSPRYGPWDQRLCLIPDSDLFEAINAGRAAVATGGIDRFTPTGIRLKSGEEIPADIIVTATGLKVEVAGGAEIFLDGEKVEFARTLNYKGVMFSGVPNFASTFGYTNASWTLKADLTSEYIARLLTHMDAIGADVVVPHLDDPAAIGEAPLVDFSSGYIRRAIDRLPKQGKVKPWRLDQSYFHDLVALRYGRIDDGVMRFSTAPRQRAKRRA